MTWWPIREEPQYVQGYKKLQKSGRIDRVDRMVERLRSEDNPRAIGEYKAGLGFYGVDVDSQLRIGYDIIKDEILLLDLIDVGDHKRVYHHD